LRRILSKFENNKILENRLYTLNSHLDLKFKKYDIDVLLNSPILEKYYLNFKKFRYFKNIKNKNLIFDSNLKKKN
jgi:hypothetical protein